MINEEIKEILLSRRILREDPIGDKWIKEYISEVLEKMEIDNLEILVCNTLQRRSSCATMRDKTIIILDNYTAELFLIFNQIFVNEDDTKYLEPIFYKIIYESLFVRNQIKLAAIYKTLARKKIKEIGGIHINQISRDSTPRYLYPQQTFLVMHEVLHALFKDSPEACHAQKDITEKLLDKIFYSRSAGRVKLINDEYLEEISCDHLAAISTIMIAKEYGNCTEVEAAVGVILALHFQFLLLEIDRMAEDDLSSDSVGEFAVRVTVVRLFVSNYFKVLMPEMVEEINSRINDAIKIWENRYMAIITDFLTRYQINKKYFEEKEISAEELEKLKQGLRKGFEVPGVEEN